MRKSFIKKFSIAVMVAVMVITLSGCAPMLLLGLLDEDGSSELSSSVEVSSEMAVSASSEGENSSAVESSNVESSVIEENTMSWEKQFSKDLVDEIRSAFTEIGENPNNIISVEYVTTQTTGFVFERKHYKVEFSYKPLQPGYNHSRYYKLTTQNYFDGEPEKEEYPNEFLVTLKFWVGDDGDGTNINQWTWTGNGRMQDGYDPVNGY